MRKLCINCRDTYEDDDEEENLWGYCWYCREVVWGKPDDSWLPILDLKDLHTGFQVLDEIEEENEENRE